MSRIPFLVEPVDVLYFGPPAAASAGEEHGASSLFPPPVSAWQGLVRGKILMHSAGRLRRPLNDWSSAAVQEREAIIGPPDRLPAGWRLAGPWPFRVNSAGEQETWFPTPGWLRRAHKPGGTTSASCACGKSLGAPTIATPLEHAAVEGLESSDGLTGAIVASFGEGTGRMATGWVPASTLVSLLSGAGIPKGPWRAKECTCEAAKQEGLIGADGDLPPFVVREARTGVAIGTDGTAMDHMLYTDEVLRFAQGAGLAGRLDAPVDAAALTKGVGNAGRKARGALFGPARFDGGLAALEEGAWINGATSAWVYLASDWCPDASDPRRPPLHLPDLRVTVTQAILGAPRWLGGYDLVNRTSRPKRAFVPAGGAWHIQLDGGTPDSRREALRRIHGSHPFLPDHDPRAAFGEGRVFVGLSSESPS